MGSATDLLGTGLALALLCGAASLAQAQIMRCTDARTGEVTYTNGRCIEGENARQIHAAQSPEEIAQERTEAAKARERSQAQMARDEAQRRQREELERKAQAAAQAQAQARTGNASPENSPACRQARERHNAILAEPSPDLATWGERSVAAQQQMEMSCLGAAAYQQLQQSRALQPNAINRPQWHGRPPHPAPPAQRPAPIVNCNVFRCYDSRGGVHPIP